MSTKRIDARGLSCPQPVVLANRAIEEGHNSFEVIVDNEVSRENIFRLAKKRSLNVHFHEEGSDIVISIAR
jgi:TusA-related sulfurtransferase